MSGHRWLLLLGLLLMAAPAALVVDAPVARWCLGDHCPHLIRDLFRISELFGHGLGVLIIALVVYQLDPARRRALPRVLAAALGSGLAANGVKMFVSRARPSGFDLSAGILSSFGGWFPLTSAGSGGQGFPSGHVATAAGLAVALAWLYPAGRNLFVAMVVVVMCQRLETSAHFLSDTLAGAAVGLVVGTAVVRARWPGHWTGRITTAPRAARNPLGTHRGGVQQRVPGGDHNPETGLSSLGAESSSGRAARRAG